MESLYALAARLDQASATLTALARAVTATDPAQAAFGADGPGRPGELGRALHRQWATATDNRAREATNAATRLAAAASAIRTAADRYADTDDATRYRLTAADLSSDRPDPWFGAEATGRGLGAELRGRGSGAEPTGRGSGAEPAGRGFGTEPGGRGFGVPRPRRGGDG